MVLTLILKALLKPLAKKPPKGPIKEANVDKAMLCNWNGYRLTVSCKNSHYEYYPSPVLFNLAASPPTPPNYLRVKCSLTNSNLINKDGKHSLVNQLPTC